MSNKNLTCNDIITLMQVHVHDIIMTNDIKKGNKGEGINRSLLILENKGLLNKSGKLTAREGISTYTTSSKGKKMVEMLCETPLPVNTWEDPRKFEISDY